MKLIQKTPICKASCSLKSNMDLMDTRMDRIVTKRAYTSRVNQTLTKNSSVYLKAILKSENAAKLPISQVFLIWKLLKRLDDELVKSMAHFEERNNVFRTGVSSLNLQAAFRLRVLLSIVPIDNSEADFIVMHHGRAHLFERSETFLSHFVSSLEFDEDGNVKGSFGRQLILYLVKGNEQTMLRLLLDRNVNMVPTEEAEHEREITPFCLACDRGNEEIVAMFMYYNVVPNRLPVWENGRSVIYKGCIDYAMIREHQNVIEMLMDYCYDGFSDLRFDVFYKFALDGSLNFFKLAKLQRENRYTLKFWYHKSFWRQFWFQLFSMSSNIFKEVLFFFTRFSDARQELLEIFLADDWALLWSNPAMRTNILRENFLANLGILGTVVAYPEAITFLHMMMDKIHDSLPLRVVMEACVNNLIPFEETHHVILLLLSNNAPLDNYTFELIYKFACRTGNYELFDICRTLDVDFSQGLPDHYNRTVRGYLVSSLYYRFPIDKTIIDIVRDENNISRCNIAYLTHMSSYPTLKVKLLSWDLKSITGSTAETDRWPEFPSLLEFARDAARKHVVAKHEVKIVWQFYEAVKKLQIPEKLKKIIAYDLKTPLYR